MQPNARIGRRSVPVAPVTGDAAQRFRHLVPLGLELLQTKGIGALTLDQLDQLTCASPNSVDVPGDDFHRNRLSRTGARGATSRSCLGQIRAALAP
jgi:hypothetical protein